MTRPARSLPLVSVLLAAPVLAGCQSQPVISPDFGVAVERNAAFQLVDPLASSSLAAVEMDGEKLHSAWKRYRAGKVTPPAVVSPSGFTGQKGDK